MKLSATEQEILNHMREARKGEDSAYDVIIFSDNAKLQRIMFSELQWQIMHGPGEELANAYGENAIIKLILLKIPA